jgi:UDP-N-acetylmuramyl pentapeptide synthase
MIFTISASQVAGITHISHQHLANFDITDDISMMKNEDLALFTPYTLLLNSTKFLIFPFST